MAEAPRRKRLEKTVDDSMTIQTSQKVLLLQMRHIIQPEKGLLPSES